MRSHSSDPTCAANRGRSPVKPSGMKPNTRRANAAPVGTSTVSSSGRYSSTISEDQIRERTVESTAAPGFSGRARSTASRPSAVARWNSSTGTVPTSYQPLSGADLPAQLALTVTGGMNSTSCGFSSLTCSSACFCRRARRSSSACACTVMSRVESASRCRARRPMMTGVLEEASSGSREQANTATTRPRAVRRIAASGFTARAREM